MKRFVLFLLLATLPLQLTWAAAFAHCPRGSSHGTYASVPGDASHAAQSHVHDNDAGDEGRAAGSGLDCSLFHAVAIEPPAAAARLLPHSGATAADVTCSGYHSHIPDGLDRPKWRSAA